MLKFSRLKYEIAFYFIFLLLGFSIVSSVVFLPREYNTEINNYKSTCRTILKNVEPNIAQLLYVNDIVELKRVADRIRQSNKDFVYCFVLDPDRKIVVHTFENGFPSDLLKVNNEAGENSALLDFGNISVYDFSYPIADGRLGSIRIGVSRERLMQVITHNIVNRLLILFLFIVLGVFIAFYISRLITNPLSELVISTKRISGGDFIHPVKISSKDEIGILADSFNLMSMSLKNLTDALENKIKQLNETNEEYLALNEEYESQNHELLKAKEKAEECDGLKTAFLANLSHEIRTPMNGILGFAELLKSGDTNAQSQAEYIEMIEQSGQRMLKLISDLVDISKIESGQVKIISEPTNVSQLINRIYQFFFHEARNKGLGLVVRTPETNGDTVIMTDSLKLEQVISNLISNALKFTAKGNIEFGYSLNKEELIFFVKDTGIGIPGEMRELIFERFRQVNDVSFRREEGSGLGLAICKSFVEMMGGTIWVDSQKGKGSEFCFTIPVKTPVGTGNIADGGKKQNIRL